MTASVDKSATPGATLPGEPSMPTEGSRPRELLAASKPHRVQLSRAKGCRLPPNTVKVDRSTPWGNPFVVGKPGGAYTAKVVDRRHAWQLYRSIALDNEKLIAAAREHLRGKNLACWCPHPAPYGDDECHAAVLLEIANG